MHDIEDIAFVTAWKKTKAQGIGKSRAPPLNSKSSFLNQSSHKLSLLQLASGHRRRAPATSFQAKFSATNHQMDRSVTQIDIYSIEPGRSAAAFPETGLSKAN